MKWLLTLTLLFVWNVSSLASESKVISDVVKKVREDDEGVVVLFSANSGSYYLRREVSNFASFRKILEESLKSKKPVSVTVEPSQLNILEVK